MFETKVDQYIENLAAPQQVIANQIRHLLLHIIPEIQEKLSFNIPFYHYYGMFCYINAIPGGINLGFCRGKDLTHAFPSLENKGRAIVASLSLFSLADIHHKQVREIIVAAALWNKEAKLNKIPMVQRKPFK